MSLGISLNYNFGKNNTLKTDKLYYLEGLRGIAALAVLIGHTLGAFWPGRMNFELDPTNPLFFLHVFYDGGFSVLIFFALSGYVLTYRAYSDDGMKILVNTAIKRYPRLMIPALASILLGYFLLKSGLMFNQAVSKDVNSIWLGYFYKFDADFLYALYQGVAGAIFNGETSYNSSLWTLTIEFYGALLVVFLSMIFRRVDFCKYFVVFVLSLLGIWSWGTYGIYYAVMMAGMMLGMRRNNHDLNVSCVFLLFIISLWMGGYNDSEMYYPFNSVDVVLNGHVLDKATLFKGCGSIIMLMCILNNSLMKKIFSSSICKFLGRISFSVYLIHVAIICSMGSWIYLLILKTYSQPLAAIAAIIVSISFSLLLSVPFEMFVDKKSTKFSGWLSKRILSFFYKMYHFLKDDFKIIRLRKFINKHQVLTVFRRSEK